MIPCLDLIYNLYSTGMHNDFPKTIQAISSGFIAVEILSIDQEASVLGTMSRGLFLETASRWLVFVSFERFRSPLTVTLAGSHALLQGAKPKMRVEIAAGLLYFKDINMAITTHNSRVWRSDLPAAAPLPKPKRLAKLTSCAGMILSEKPGVGLGQFLAPLLKLPDAQFPDDQDRYLLRINMPLLQGYIADQEAEKFTRVVTSLLGAGQGLTPSWDDFVTGLLLALNRWEDVLWPGDGLLDINRQVVEAAYRKTTRLSANLIEMAAQGKGDERLIKTLDPLMSDIPNESEALRDLLGWGHSSGVDAFVGMAVALSAC